MHAGVASQKLAMQVSQELAGGPAHPGSAERELDWPVGTASCRVCTFREPPTGRRCPEPLDRRAESNRFRHHARPSGCEVLRHEREIDQSRCCRRALASAGARA